MHASAPPLELSLALRTRLRDLWEHTGHAGLQRLADGLPPHDGASLDDPQERADWISTTLMDVYKRTGDATVFALLFECNQAAFLVAVQGHLRRAHSHVDAADVLQEAFLNIYRYPHRFLPDRADAFRNWGHRIVRNTALKFLRGEGKLSRQQSLDDEFQCEDMRARSPLRAATEHEGAEIVDHAYVLYLSLYLLHFERLSPREQRALTMVEVEGRHYRDAAAELGIRLENLKMVVFRGRQKIFRGMGETLAAISRHGSVPEALAGKAHSGVSRASDSAATRIASEPRQLDVGD